jgi:uncharacterized membrane protein
MINLIVGACAAAVMFFGINHARCNALSVSWWKWLLTVLAVIYAVFVVLLGIGFLQEGATQAALVMSLILGIPAVVFAVLLVRFVFSAPHHAG